MEIAAYNEHTRLLSSESWSVTATKFTRSGGADAVIQSRIPFIRHWPLQGMLLIALRTRQGAEIHDTK